MLSQLLGEIYWNEIESVPRFQDGRTTYALVYDYLSGAPISYREKHIGHPDYKPIKIEDLDLGLIKSNMLSQIYQKLFSKLNSKSIHVQQNRRIFENKLFSFLEEVKLENDLAKISRIMQIASKKGETFGHLFEIEKYVSKLRSL